MLHRGRCCTDPEKQLCSSPGAHGLGITVVFIMKRNQHMRKGSQQAYLIIPLWALHLFK